MSASQIKDNIQNDMKLAMKAREAARLSTIRLILSAFKQFEVDERSELIDVEALKILDKLAKQRRDSIEQFESANRHDLAEKEKEELALIISYLPSQLSEEEIDKLIKEAVVTAKASSMKDMGAVMAALKPKIQGRADMATVSKKLKDALT